MKPFGLLYFITWFRDERSHPFRSHAFVGVSNFHAAKFCMQNSCQRSQRSQRPQRPQRLEVNELTSVSRVCSIKIKCAEKSAFKSIFFCLQTIATLCCTLYKWKWAKSFSLLHSNYKSKFCSAFLHLNVFVFGMFFTCALFRLLTSLL